MARMKQVFANCSDQSLVLFLEMSTARFRLEPGEEMILFYDDAAHVDGPGAPLRIVYVIDGASPQITIYTDEDTMFLPDGTEAELDYS